MKKVLVKFEDTTYSTIKGFVDNIDCRCPESVSGQVDQGDRASLSSLLPRRERMKMSMRPIRHTLNMTKVEYEIYAR